jgi:hypothetical protein
VFCPVGFAGSPKKVVASALVRARRTPRECRPALQLRSSFAAFSDSMCIQYEEGENVVSATPASTRGNQPGLGLRGRLMLPCSPMRDSHGELFLPDFRFSWFSIVGRVREIEARPIGRVLNQLKYYGHCGSPFKGFTPWRLAPKLATRTSLDNTGCECRAALQLANYFEPIRQKDGYLRWERPEKSERSYEQRETEQRSN